MTRYHSPFGELVSSLAPVGKGAVPSPPAGGLHSNDAGCFGPLMPLVANIIKEVTPKTTLSSFSSFSGERSVQRKLRTNVVDPTAVRNFTSWLGANITIGGQSVRYHWRFLSSS